MSDASPDTKRGECRGKSKFHKPMIPPTTASTASKVQNKVYLPAILGMADGGDRACGGSDYERSMRLQNVNNFVEHLKAN
jgi:hypothetical protein